MNIALVGELLGHSDPKTTRRYINPTAPTIDIAREILNNRKLA
jgi:hypothetical protein